jgi:hypothetical protein
MISLKIRTFVLGLFSALLLAGAIWLGYDYYTLRQQHLQILLYLVQPVKTDSAGNPVQRAQALDELIPKEQVKDGTVPPGADGK